MKATSNRLSKDNFMKQTKIAKIEELLQKAVQENATLKAAEQETQQLVSEMNEDAEDYEIEIQTLKLRLCDLQATKITLEKTNSVLSKTGESHRVRETLKKLGELEKEHQAALFEKDELEVKLAEVKDMLEQNKAQGAELERHQLKLSQAEQQLSDAQTQYSAVTKENVILKENIVRLEDCLRASEIEKDKLKSDLKQARKIKKPGYSRGGLFIGDQGGNAEDGKANMKFRGPQTSTPLTSPRGSAHSRSFERPAPKQRVLKRYYSLDSLNVSKSDHGLNGRLSASLDNLDIDSSREHDVTPEVMDTSYESMNGSEYSLDLSEPGGFLRKSGQRQSVEEVRVRGLEDWETVSDVSSVLTADTLVLTDLDADVDTEQSDSESVRCLKLRFEQSGAKQPAKISRRRSSSLTSAPTLTTLVEKHEEAASNSEEVSTVSEIVRSTSDAAARISDNHSDLTKTPDIRPSNVDTERPDDHATSSDDDPKVSICPLNTEILEIAVTETAHFDVLSSPGDCKPKRNMNFTSKENSNSAVTLDETELAHTLSSADDFEPNIDQVDRVPDSFHGNEARASLVCGKLTADSEVKSSPTDNECESISQVMSQSEENDIECQVNPLKSSDIDIALEGSNSLAQPDKSWSADALVPLDQTETSSVSLPSVTCNSPATSDAERMLIGSEIPSITGSTPNVADGESSDRSSAVPEKNKLLVVISEPVESSDVTVKVKDIKSLWEERENRRSKIQYNRRDEANVGAKKATSFASGSVNSSQGCSAGNDGGKSSDETPKLAKVSDLVSLWNNLN